MIAARPLIAHVYSHDPDVVLDKILNKERFDKPLPLPMLIDIMVDLWEADGLFE